MKIYFSAAQIADAVARTAREINAYYAEVGPEERVTVVASLKGAAIFFADLVHIIRHGLIYVIIEPVGIKKLAR